jgi:hypothetical protein
MALDIQAIIDAIVTDLLASGYFERVNAHEPKSSPGSGLTAAVWVQDIRAVQSSGLDSSSALLVFSVRLYTSMAQEPLDAIDPQLVNAVSTLFSAFAGGYTLGGLVREVDVRGSEGVMLEAKAGYLKQADFSHRVITITLPVVVNDVWEEAA